MKAKTRLILRPGSTQCKTVIEHDGSMLTLTHLPRVGFADTKEIPLSDPNLIDEICEWVADWGNGEDEDAIEEGR